MVRKKVLQVAYSNLANGGIQAVIMGIVRNLSDDIDFDIVLFTSKTQYYDDEFLKYGNIFRIPIREKKSKLLDRCEHFYRWVKIFFGCYRILKRGNYDAIHCHNEEESGLCTFAARCTGVRVRISHAHNNDSFQKHNYIKRIYKNIMGLLITVNSNVRIGCSKQANEYMFGKKDKQAIVINNAIDFGIFDKNKYQREANNIAALNFIHVGRFCSQKNQLFLLEVFNLLKKRWAHSQLTLIGFGKDLDAITKKIQELGIEDSVKILPHNSNIPMHLANSDYMIFPSRFEGLGIALLEAQVMGVRCFVSDAVPPEANMGLCTYFSLDDGPEVWAENIVNYINTHKDEKREISSEIKDRYDIIQIANKYRSIYYGA